MSQHSQSRYAWIFLLVIAVTISFLSQGRGTFISALGASIGQVMASILMASIVVGLTWVLSLLVSRRSYSFYIWANAVACVALAVTLLIIVFGSSLKSSVNETVAETMTPRNSEPAIYSNRYVAPVAREAPLETSKIPDQFLGFWSSNCAEENGGDFRVEPSKLAFYESDGPVTRVVQLSSSEILVFVTLTGEGSTWSTSLTLALSPNLEILTMDAITKLRVGLIRALGFMSNSPTPQDVTIELEGLGLDLSQGRFAAQRRVKSNSKINGRPEYEEIVGEEYSSKRVLVHKTQVIDRKKHYYKKVVVEVDTGVILKDQEQDLKDHQGYGYAKRKKTKA